MFLREAGEELTAIEMAESGYPGMLSWGDDFKDPLQQHYPLELSVRTDMLYMLHSILWLPASHVRLLSTRNMARVTEELYF